MGQKKILKRSKVKPFVKFINLNHLMPTRYSLSDIEPLKSSVKPESVRKVGDGRVEAKKAVKKQFEERYLSKAKQTGGSQYFFAKLRF
jgi:ribosomal protein L14E/L6E/L27E